MKISFSGFDYPEGKVKYEDGRLDILKEKANPAKCTPFYAELFRENFIQADVIAVKKDSLLDVILPDIEKCETRLKNSADPAERELVAKSLKYLEEEVPLCEAPMSADEKKTLRALTMLTVKPVLVLDDGIPVNSMIEKALAKAGMIFFYTAGPKEVRSWLVREKTPIVECAGEIHSDLERGFIRGDVVSFEDFITCHNMNDAKSKGLARLVERDYPVRAGEVIEIRSGV